MRYRIFLTAITFSCSIPVLALAASGPPLETVCAQLQDYSSAGANFVPGVDVNGKPVTPADLGNGSGGGIYDPVIIPITVDVSPNMGTQGLEGKPEISYLEIYSDGRVMLNGDDIGPDIRASCPLDTPQAAPNGMDRTPPIP